MYYYEGTDTRSLTLYERNVRQNGKTFEFDHVYDPTVPQYDIHQTEVAPLVQGLFQGRDACVVAMGSPLGGVKYTVEGPMEHPGIFYRTLDSLFAIARMSNARRCVMR